MHELRCESMSWRRPAARRMAGAINPAEYRRAHAKSVMLRVAAVAVAGLWVAVFLRDWGIIG